VIDYLIGDEHRSGPFGRVGLHIELEGEATLELHSPDGRHAWAGQVDHERLFEIMDALDAAQFPSVPDHVPPAEAPLRSLTLDLQGNVDTVELAQDLGEELEGYKDAFAILDSIVVQLSGGLYAGAQDTLEPSVTDIRPI
jgi:hypothetical protein